jgi:cobalt-zinc-cadmium efflux system membrane fusion protein
MNPANRRASEVLVKASRNRPLALARRHGPTLAVLLALAALAWWGHRSGWKMPKISAIRDGAGPAAVEDWCALHNVPESKCIACRPDLLGTKVARGDLWCREHGVPESQCTVCHPEILTRGEASDWCAEHGVPESQCTLCNPAVAIKGELPAEPLGDVTVLAGEGAEAEMRSRNCMTHALRVQFASPEAVRKAGIALAAVEERPMADSIEAPAEIEYDQTRLARVSSRLAGTAWRVEAGAGDRVKKGDILLLVDAAEAGRARADFLQALALVEVKDRGLKRIEASADAGWRQRGELEEARAALRAARIGLFAAGEALASLGLAVDIEALARSSDADLAKRARFLGLPDALRERIEKEEPTANVLPIAAPLDGVVVERDVVPGEAVEPSKVLMVVADTSRMWAMIDVKLEDADRLAPGGPVLFRQDGSSGDAAAGKIAWISTSVDERTRTVKARAELENPEGSLRAHAFGTARIIVRETPDAVAVPSDAVQWEGCCHIVFVRVRDDVFQTRKVRLGARGGGFVEVLAGVAAGEVVAARGSHVLKSEILRSRLGAGCCAE